MRGGVQRARAEGKIMLLLILAACGSSPAPAPVKPTMPTEMAAPMPGMAMPSSATMDQMFIDMMVPHHQGAIEMAKIAQTRGEHPEIKAMAEGILTSQQAEIGNMKAWRKAWFGSDETPSMGMPMAHSEMPGMAAMPGMSSMDHMAKDIEGLRTATPFDLAFLPLAPLTTGCAADPQLLATV